MTRLCLVFALILLGPLACSRTGPLRPDQVPGAIERLSSSREGTRRAAEARLESTPPALTWGPLATLASDPRAPSPARAAAIRIFSATVTVGLPNIVGQLAGDSDAAVRGEAIQALLAWGDPMQATSLDRAVALLQDSAARAQVSAARQALLSGRHRFDLERLRHASDPSERLTAARSLADFGTAEDLPRLLEGFEGESEEGVRQQIILAVAAIGARGAHGGAGAGAGDPAPGFVRERLSDPDPFLRAAAAMGETSLRDPQAVEGLRIMLDGDPVGDNRLNAAQALAVLGTPVAWAALREGCSRQGKGVVRQTCGSLLRPH